MAQSNVSSLSSLTRFKKAGGSSSCHSFPILSITDTRHGINFKSYISHTSSKTENYSIKIRAVESILKPKLLSKKGEWMYFSSAQDQSLNGEQNTPNFLSQKEWTKDQKLSKYRILAQIMADEIVESAKMKTWKDLHSLMTNAIADNIVTASEAQDIMDADIVAEGQDLETIFLIADGCVMGEGDFAITTTQVESILLKASILRKVVEAPVLPLLLGFPVQPEANAAAISSGIHIILRDQNEKGAIY